MDFTLVLFLLTMSCCCRIPALTAQAQHWITLMFYQVTYSHRLLQFNFRLNQTDFTCFLDLKEAAHH